LVSLRSEWNTTPDPSKDVNPCKEENHIKPSLEKKTIAVAIAGKEGLLTCRKTGRLKAL